MLACIPTRGNAGLQDTVSDHFGSAPFFTLYDSTKDELTVVKNTNAHHSHGTCHPMNQLGKYHIDCIVCSGIGRRAIEALNTEGIKVFYCPSKKVADIIGSISAGTLNEIDAATACHGRGVRGGGTTQGRGAGHGRGTGCQHWPGGPQGRPSGRGRRQGGDD